MCVCVYDVCGAHVHMEVRGQLCEVESLLPPLYRFWGWNWGCQACVTSAFTWWAISPDPLPTLISRTEQGWTIRESLIGHCKGTLISSVNKSHRGGWVAVELRHGLTSRSWLLEGEGIGWERARTEVNCCGEAVAMRRVTLEMWQRG